MNIEANSIIVECTGKAFQYDVLIEIAGREKKIAFNKETASPLDKLYNRSVIKVVYDLSSSFGGSNLKYVFDGSSIMYTNVQFEGIEFELDPEKFTPELKKAFRHRLLVTIKPTESHHILDMQKPVDKMTLDERGEFKRLISLLVSQDVVNRGEYCVLNQNNLFVTDDKKKIEIPGGIEFRPGFSKGIRFIKDNGHLHPVVDVDYRVSAFYKSQAVFFTGQEINNFKAASDFMRGVIVHPDYNPHRRLNFTSFSEKTPQTQKFNLDDGQEISVYDYFMKNKNQKINPQIPLANVKPKQAGFFPSERLIIAPYQKIQIERLPPVKVDELHKSNAVQPFIRHKATLEIIRSLNLNNDIVRGFGVKFSSSMASVQPQPFNKPRVQVGGNVSVPKDDGNFRDPRARYILPAAVPGWVVFYGAGRGQRPDMGIINGFVKNLMEKGKQKGMQIPPPKDVVAIDMDKFKDIAFEKCNKYIQQGVRYIMVIDGKTNFDTHRIVKLMECRYRIVTQQLDYKLVDKCVRQNQNMTLENILNKMNVKNGGCNYAPKFEEEANALALDKGTLVIGYQARHSKVSSTIMNGKPIHEPSVVGFSSNSGKHPDMFVGTYVYQHDPRYEVDFETVDPNALSKHIIHILNQRKKNLPQMAKPANVVILRDGVSEYQYGKLMTEELKYIRQAFTAYDPNYNPKILFCVTTKEHNVRLYLRTNRIENPPPGIIVNSGIVRKGMEFIIVPQKAIKGTAEPLKVAVLLNETSVNFIGIQKFIHALSYSHQLTCAPTALPEPIYQSQILSQRGFSVFNTYKEHFSANIPWNKEKTAYDLEVLNERLSMNNTALENIRYTA